MDLDSLDEFPLDKVSDLDSHLKCEFKSSSISDLTGSPVPIFPKVPFSFAPDRNGDEGFVGLELVFFTKFFLTDSHRLLAW